MENVKNRIMKLSDYGTTLTVTDPLTIAYFRVHALKNREDETAFRRTPEGRKCLLLIARERRKEPLEIRRLPMLMGKTAAESICKIIKGVIK